MVDETQQLSEREREILQLVATGLSNQQIAFQLGISPNTVKVHLRNVYSKIGVASRSEATLYAVRNRIVDVTQEQSSETPVPPTEQHTPLPEDRGSATAMAVPPDDELETDVSDDQESVASFPLAEPLVEPARPGPLKVRTLRYRSLLAVSSALLLVCIWAVMAWYNGQTPDIQEPQRWRESSELQQPRAHFALANVGAYLYVISGEEASGIVGTVERFDTRSANWTALSSKPTPVKNAKAAVIGGKIYVPGGTSASGVVNIFERYDPLQERWTTLSALPVPRSGYGLATLEGKLYLFGGWDGSTYRAEVFEYDPDTDRWRERQPIQMSRAYMATAVVEDRIYILGGETESGTTRLNETFTPALGDTEVWAAHPPLPQPRSHFDAAAIGSTIYVLGGSYTDERPLKFNTLADSWQTFGVPPVPIGQGSGTALVNEQLYSIGGKDRQQKLSAYVQSYQAIFTNFLPSEYK